MAAPRGPAPGLLSKPALQAMLRQLLPAPAQHQPPAGAGAGAGTNTPAVVLGRTQECQVIDRCCVCTHCLASQSNCLRMFAAQLAAS